MIEKDESVYVRHMLDAIDRIGQYLEGVDRANFLEDSLLQDGVIRQFEILGEAAGRVSRETCSAAPETPWAKVTGMRHRLIHDYFEVDTAMVWKAASVDLTDLRPNVEALLQRLTGA